MRNCPTFATSFAAFSEARPDLTQLAGKLLMKMDNSSYVSTPSRPYARSMLDWLESPELRRRCHAGLNKSEQRHALAQVVCTFKQGSRMRNHKLNRTRYSKT